jgi:hypothetical protein
MARRVILDTGTLTAIERGKLDVDAVLGADDAATAAATNRIPITAPCSTCGCRSRAR